MQPYRAQNGRKILHQVANELGDVHKSQYECYAIRDHPNAVFYLHLALVDMHFVYVAAIPSPISVGS
jgi:hypothetical protein